MRRTASRSVVSRSPTFEPSPTTTRTSGRVALNLERVRQLSREAAIDLPVLDEEEERAVLQAAERCFHRDDRTGIRVEADAVNLRGRGGFGVHPRWSGRRCETACELGGVEVRHVAGCSR